MTAVLSLDDEGFASLLDAMKQYGENAADVVTAVIHDAGDDIYKEIDPLINPSGRKFKGHSSGAKGSKWQHYDTREPLEISVSTTSKRHYLYFPDDGSNTKHHYGDQQFMLRGAQAAAPGILEKGINALVRNFEGS